MGWQLRLRRLTRQAVCVVLKVGTVTSRTSCPSSPAKTGGHQADESPVGTPVWGPRPKQASGGAAGLTFEQLGLEAGSVAAEVDVRAVGEDERVRFVEGVAAWEGWKLGGEPAPAPLWRANSPQPQCPPSSRLTQGVWGGGADVSRQQRPLQDLQVVVHAAVFQDVADILPRRPQKPTTFEGKKERFR